MRPEIELPDYDGLELTVDSVEVGDDEVTEELERLRSRFGTLITVDRPAKTGDFVTLDLVAVIDDTEVDTASGISYELGSGELLEGIDEALDSLTAGETTTFESKLLGGDHEGETAEITVDRHRRQGARAPRGRRRLRADRQRVRHARRAHRRASRSRSPATSRSARAPRPATARRQARSSSSRCPVADSVIEDEVHRHLESENRLEDDEHRAEVTESSDQGLQDARSCSTRSPRPRRSRSARTSSPSTSCRAPRSTAWTRTSSCRS